MRVKDGPDRDYGCQVAWARCTSSTGLPWLLPVLFELLSMTAKHLCCVTTVQDEPCALSALVDSSNAVRHLSSIALAQCNRFVCTQDSGQTSTWSSSAAELFIQTATARSAGKYRYDL